MSFDDDWEKNGRFIDVTHQYKDDIRYKKIRFNGRWKPIKYRFAMYTGRNARTDSSYVTTLDWLNEHLPDRAWSCDTFCGGWFFVEFVDAQTASAFRLMKC